MSLGEVLSTSYRWLDGHDLWLLALCCAIALLGTALAWFGKQGRTDANGQWIASAVVGAASCTVP